MATIVVHTFFCENGLSSSSKDQFQILNYYKNKFQKFYQRVQMIQLLLQSQKSHVGMTKNFILILTLLVSSLCFYEGNSPVQSLTSSDFSKTKKGLWLVEFYAPWCGHCQRLTPQYEKAAKALKGIANIAAVDATKENTGVSVQGYPTIKFYNDGKESDYNGGRTSQEIVNWILGEFKKIANSRLGGGNDHSGHDHSGHGHGQLDEKDVVILTESNFDELVINSNDAWFVQFYAPWCGHCKTLAPEWAEMATDLKGEIKVGKVDATVHSSLGSRFGVNGYPTIKFFPSGKKSDSDAVPYEGGRSASAIAEWGREQTQGSEGPAIPQLVSQELYNNKCKGKNVCIVAFLPHILDSSEAERQKYLQVLKSVAADNRRKPFSFMWSQGGDQYDFEVAFGADGAGYPAVVAISESRKVFSKMLKSFNEGHLEDFVGSLIGKNGRFSTFRGETPKIKQIKVQQSGSESHEGCDQQKCTAPHDEQQL